MSRSSSSSRSRLSRLVGRYEFVLAMLAVIVLFVGLTAAAFSWGNAGDTKGAAREEALESGFTRVDSVDRKWFGAWCAKRYTGYEVTGTFEGESTTKVVCVGSFRAYMR